MTEDTDKLDKRLARLLEEGRQGDPEEHPSPDKLAAYYMNELRPEEADAIQEHLAECTFCADLILDLGSSLGSPAEESARKGVADLGTEAGWRKVRAEMGWRGEPAVTEVAQLRRRLRFFQALAAVLLVGVLGVSTYSQYSLQKLRNRPVFEAFVSGDQGVRGPKDNVVELTSMEDVNVFLALSLSGLEESSYRDFPKFRAEVRREGKTVLTQDGLLLSDNGVLLPIPSDLEPGSYRIELYGLKKGPPAPVQQYTIQIERR